MALHLHLHLQMCRFRSIAWPVEHAVVWANINLFLLCHEPTLTFVLSDTRLDSCSCLAPSSAKCMCTYMFVTSARHEPRFSHPKLIRFWLHEQCTCAISRSCARPHKSQRGCDPTRKFENPSMPMYPAMPLTAQGLLVWGYALVMSMLPFFSIQ